MAPAYAVPRMLERAGLGIEDFDLFEIHEAFASQVLATLAAWEKQGARPRSTGPASTWPDRPSPPAIPSPRPVRGSSPPSPNCSPSGTARAAG